jgi:hypothetical protein
VGVDIGRFDKPNGILYRKMIWNFRSTWRCDQLWICFNRLLEREIGKKFEGSPTFSQPKFSYDRRAGSPSTHGCQPVDVEDRNIPSFFNLSGCLIAPDHWRSCACGLMFARIADVREFRKLIVEH